MQTTVVPSEDMSTEHDATAVNTGSLQIGVLSPSGPTPSPHQTTAVDETGMVSPSFPTPSRGNAIGDITALTDVPARGDNVLVPGTMLGDYRIERKVAEGGWGTVFSAVHPLIGKRVAVKVLRKKHCERKDAVRRFVDEARAVNHIGHPNIVDVFTFGETFGGRSYFMMEWLKGETLFKRMKRDRLTILEICAVVKPVARALEAAHAKGIIHRDVKPDNIFVVYVDGEAPHIKLLDFGIAKLRIESAGTKSGNDHTSTGEIIGTPRYMSPEQARGRNIDHRSDVYSLGATLFELLAGRAPFEADNTTDELAALLTTPSPPLSLIGANVPRELVDLVGAMLAKDAYARPTLRHVCAVLDQVEAAAGRRPSRAVSVVQSVRSASGRAARFSLEWASTRVRLLAICGALVVATAIIAVVVSSREPANRDTATVILQVSGARSYDVLLDDRVVKPDDGKLTMSPGLHSIEVRAPGAKTETFQINAVAGTVLRQSVRLQH